jgi:hypothetical protein
MASRYKLGLNPIQDFLFTTINYGVDISSKKHRRDVVEAVKLILENILEDENVSLYLDFEIKKKDNYFKVIANNAITALWFSGVMVENVEDTFKSDYFIIGDKRYHYDRKTKKLTYKTKS